MKLIATIVAFLFICNVYSQSLIFSVKDAYRMSGLGWMVIGNVESGVMKNGDKVEVRGGDKVLNLEVKNIFIDGISNPQATPGKEADSSTRSQKAIKSNLICRKEKRV